MVLSRGFWVSSWITGATSFSPRTSSARASTDAFGLIPVVFGSGVDTALVGRDLDSPLSFDERLYLCFKSDFFDFFFGIWWISSSELETNLSLLL